MIHGDTVESERCEEVLAGFSFVRWFENTGGWLSSGKVFRLTFFVGLVLAATFFIRHGSNECDSFEQLGQA